ncbi:MAG: tetratricopeptide repeat protein [Verrucomicrobia bacterium]|nr:tetratricopeptide repeat protein [Verrucomicrobiota bacterium]
MESIPIGFKDQITVKTLFVTYRVIVVLGLAGIALPGCKPSGPGPAIPQTAPPRGVITFNRDIAPILFEHCAPCHRPGQPGPFSLLSYADAVKHAAQIVKVTQKRYMPPWLPEPGSGGFLDERRLSAGQLESFQEWLKAGTPEGNAADLPPLPQFADGWQLGEPDLVVQLPQPYTLAAEGQDIYRNFVIPAPVHDTRYVRALEFHPESRSVHHVRILLDSTRQSRRLDEQDAEPGFAGMTVPAKFPTGHMLTWTPGRAPRKEPDGLAWVLEGGADIVLQIHMQRTGKSESIQPAIGLFFTSSPPTKTPCRLGLLSELIDIPAGEKDYLVERSMELPADVDVLAVLPHLHYLGKRIEGFATLPNGKTQSLLLIKEWDFNWQSEYRYRNPVFLPKGSRITMRYTYDNSEENVRNPNLPPRRVVFGPQSTDEMGELWLQVLPRHASDLTALQTTHRLWGFQETAAYYLNQLAANSNDVSAHFGLGKVLGPLGRTEESKAHFQAAIRLDPNHAEAHYYLGLILLTDKELTEARSEFDTTLRLSPAYYKAYDGIGLVCLAEGKLAEAEAQFQAALRLNPDDPAAKQNLARLRQAKTDPIQAK